MLRSEGIVLSDGIVVFSRLVFFLDGSVAINTMSMSMSMSIMSGT